jgi:hypothetical protein
VDGQIRWERMTAGADDVRGGKGLDWTGGGVAREASGCEPVCESGLLW